MPFLNNISVKKPFTNYRQQKAYLRIRRFILEYILNLDKTLKQLKRSGTIIGAKSQFCQNEMNIIDYATNSAGQKPSATYLLKVQNWIKSSNVKEVKGFLGLVIYFRIWIKDFRLIAKPLYLLTRKGVKFYWDPNV